MTTTLQEGILDTAVCGFHQYALTPPFHLTYASQNLCAMLGLSKEELVSDAADLYAARIHPDDRRQYARFLYTLAETQQSQALTYRLVKSDGEVFHVQDTMVPQWLDDGTLVGCSTLSDVSALRQSANDQYRLRREWENQRYIQAISKVYDKIFEFDRAHNTIRCLYGQNSSVFKWLENIPMQITEAIEKWTINTVHQEDRETVLRFFSAQAPPDQLPGPVLPGGDEALHRDFPQARSLHQPLLLPQRGGSRCACRPAPGDPGLESGQ